MGKKSKKKNRNQLKSPDEERISSEMRLSTISNRDNSDVITLDDSDEPSTATFDKEDVIIDSFDSYYRILMEYLSENHWLATETIAPLLSLQHDHCNLPYLLVSLNNSMK